MPRQPVMRRGVSGRRSNQGFTLLELLLAVSLVLLLMGSMVFNFSNFGRGNELAEGTTRLETLMRFARAQAANSGRKVQLVFSSESTNTPAATTGEVRATWEPDPLRQPGCFADLGDAQWHVQEINDLVQVESVKLLEPAAASPPSLICEEDGEEEGTNSVAIKPMSPITFYPDGSSDSAEIIISPRSPEEAQRMAVRLVGITGSISHQLLSAEMDEPTSEALSTDRPVLLRRDSSSRGTSSETDSVAPAQTSRPVASSSRALSTSARATVGETNSVDQAD
jgi:prepilin-type N-terminal cleavage/methylation domain-containing protein